MCQRNGQVLRQNLERLGPGLALRWVRALSLRLHLKAAAAPSRGRGAGTGEAWAQTLTELFVTRIGADRVFPNACHATAVRVDADTV